MNLIKISTDLELSVHEFPTGTHEELASWNIPKPS